MIGIIILISLLICALCLLIALLYIRQTEIEVKDKYVDLERDVYKRQSYHHAYYHIVSRYKCIRPDLLIP